MHVPTPSTSRAVALVAALLILVPAPVTVAYSDSGGDGTQSSSYLEDWKSLKANLSSGDVDAAESTYRSTFAAPAGERPAVKSDVEAGFSAAANASSTDGVQYTVASQQIRKSLLAVAWTNVQVAVDAGDAQEARNWSDILHAKFGADVADGDATLENATTDAELAGAEETLREDLRDTVTRSATHEAVETPGLIEGGADVEAAAEAAEARYYSSIILPDVEATLGADAADTLEGELDELLDAAENGDATTAGAEAEEIVATYGEYTLQAAPREKHEARETFASHLDAGNVSQARALYQDTFAEDAHEYAADAHGDVLDALDAAENATTEADYAEASQLAAKGVVEAAFEVAFAEFEEEEFHEGLEWYAVVAGKLGWFDQPSDAAIAAGEAAALDEAGDALDRAETGTSEAFLDKVREEVEEVFIHWDDDVTAREKAAEAVAYYQPARDHVVTVLGQSSDDHFQAELEELLEATAAGNRTKAREAANETFTLLDQVEASGGEVSELDSLISDLRGKVEFVLEEWRGYHTALEEGNQDEADTEKGEARAFARNARDRARSNKALLDDANPEATDDLLTRLDDLVTLVDDDQTTLPTVQEKVNATLDALDAVKRGSLEGTVTVRLGPAEAGDSPGTADVPVTVEGLPADGGAVSLVVTYDSSLVEATNVSVDAEVGASTIEDGEVRFNAALTEAGGPVQVATLEFTPVADEAPDEVTLDVEVETLADAQGEALGLAGVEGNTVDVASAADEADAQGAPGPGVLAALAALVAAGLARRTRR